LLYASRSHLGLDQGLFGVLDRVRIVRPRITTVGGLEMQIGYSPALFPELSSMEASALLQRCTTGHA